MTITVFCKHCKNEFQTADRIGGKKETVICSQCGGNVYVPDVRGINAKGDAAPGKRDQDSKIIAKFREGVRRACSKLIWQKFKEWTEGKQVNVAKKYFLSEKQVSEGVKHGKLSIDILISVLTDKPKEYKDLDPLPSRRDRFIAGYQFAVEFVRTKVLTKKGDREVIPLLDFCVVCCFIAELEEAEISVLNKTLLQETEYWDGWPVEGEQTYQDMVMYLRRASGKKEIEKQFRLNPEGFVALWLGKFARLIKDRVEKMLGEESTYTSFDEFNRVKRKWSRELVPCLEAIPDSWFRWVKNESE